MINLSQFIKALLLLGTLHSVCCKSTASENGKHWAVLVAGSNTYDNYRHQADVCHAYHILHNHGMPDEQMVVMMYNDIAYNSRNPTPGVIINHPHGPNVYPGVPHDYTGETVTPSNFLKILRGDKEAMAGIGSGKVIESGPDDYIFVNLADHGGPGIFAFPAGGMLNANDLVNTIVAMNNERKFKEMVIYIEACYSGSMFQNLLPKNVRIYATTAANGHESSYACYWNDKYGTYLGDVYSVKWMEDSDKEKLSKETLQKQFQIVRREVNTSHVQEFGDMDISRNPVIDFEGDGTSATLRFVPEPLPDVPLEPVASELVTVSALRRTGQVKRLNKVLKEHKRMECQMNKIVNLCAHSNEKTHEYLKKRMTLMSFNCYKPVAEKFLHTCVTDTEGHDGFHFRQMYALVNMCEDNVAPDTIIDAIDHVCGTPGNHYCN